MDMETVMLRSRCEVAGDEQGEEQYPVHGCHNISGCSYEEVLSIHSIEESFCCHNCFYFLAGVSRTKRTLIMF